MKNRDGMRKYFFIKLMINKDEIIQIFFLFYKKNKKELLIKSEILIVSKDF